jgi:hypothetical protein
MTKEKIMITITDWDRLESDGNFLIGKPYKHDLTIELSPYAIGELVKIAKRQGIIVLESDGYRRNRGSLERI